MEEFGHFSASKYFNATCLQLASVAGERVWVFFRWIIFIATGLQPSGDDDGSNGGGEEESFRMFDVPYAVALSFVSASTRCAPRCMKTSRSYKKIKLFFGGFGVLKKMNYDGDTIKQWAGDSQWRMWRADLARFKKHGYSCWSAAGFWALTIYRLQRSLNKRKPRWLFILPRLIVAILRNILTAITLISLNQHAEIGPGLFIPHVGPIQVVPWAKIGADCAIHQVCTIGTGSKPGGPTIGDHVMIGCHTCILGPVKIGNKVTIGAGAVVVKDIPEGTTAVGVPAKVIDVRSH